jgi:AcrR family transcriptional regulator
VLTDGSGHTGVSRLPSTAALIARMGATAGSIFGRFPDAEIYRALLAHDTSVFTDIVEELADIIIDRQIAVVAADDAEGFNPTHDVCRLITDAAVRYARLRAGRPVLNVAFRLIDAPEVPTLTRQATSTVFALSNAALERKMAAAFAYPEMAGEVAAARKRLGDEAFRIESFRHVRDGEIWAPGDQPPYYERYGRKRVEEGAYPEVIYYEQHIRPLADLLHARSLREAS